MIESVLDTDNYGTHHETAASDFRDRRSRSISHIIITHYVEANKLNLCPGRPLQRYDYAGPKPGLCVGSPIAFTAMCRKSLDSY